MTDRKTWKKADRSSVDLMGPLRESFDGPRIAAWVNGLGGQARYEPGRALTREETLQWATRQHELRFGSDHCDPQYILSCREMPNLVMGTPQPTSRIVITGPDGDLIVHCGDTVIDTGEWFQKYTDPAMQRDWTRRRLFRVAAAGGETA